MGSYIVVVIIFGLIGAILIGYIIPILVKHNAVLKLSETHQVIQTFITYCDDSFSTAPEEGLPSTYQTGICHLVYDETNNVLHVHLRRPGLLIGKGGRTINKLEEILKCKIELHEVVLGRKTKLKVVSETPRYAE